MMYKWLLMCTGKREWKGMHSICWFVIHDRYLCVTNKLCILPPCAMSSLLTLLALPVVALASLTINDPSDVISPSDWTADNAIVPDYNVPFISAQPSDSE
jgi:hypothetical protein